MNYKITITAPESIDPGPAFDSLMRLSGGVTIVEGNGGWLDRDVLVAERVCMHTFILDTSKVLYSDMGEAINGVVNELLDAGEKCVLVESQSARGYYAHLCTKESPWMS